MHPISDPGTQPLAVHQGCASKLSTKGDVNLEFLALFLIGGLSSAGHMKEWQGPYPWWQVLPPLCPESQHQPFPSKDHFTPPALRLEGDPRRYGAGTVCPRTFPQGSFALVWP